MQQTTFKEHGIHYRNWPISGDARAVVLIVHGLGEHCERYDTFASALNTAGYAVAGLDLPGHGQSDGRRGHIDRFSEYGDAVLSLYKKTSTAYPGLPVFLLGHSMGGLISTQLLLSHQDKFAGALLSGPAIQSPQQPPAFQVAVIKLIAALFPKLGVLTLDASGISRDPVVVEDYMHDPLVNKGKLSARLLVEMFKAMEECKANADRVTLPIRIMHGGRDDMTSPEGSELLYSRVGSKDKELRIYSGLMHEILNEPEGPEITQEIIAWIDGHQ